MRNVITILIALSVFTQTKMQALEMKQPITSHTIVFIHGLFMNATSWKPWMEYFEANGFTCYAPNYQYHEGVPAELQKSPDPKLGSLTFKQVIDSLILLIDKLPEKPILIGHSMGGLAVQKLIEMEKGVAGICIDPAPPKGIFTFKWSFLKSNLPTINPFKGNSVCLPSVKWFQYAFCNTMTLEQTKIEYDKFVVPESRNIPRSTTSNQGKIDFSKPHAPLLIIAGEKDNIIPYQLNEKNYKAYKDKNSVREFKIFASRTHYICSQDKWQEVANYVSNWLTKLK